MPSPESSAAGWDTFIDAIASRLALRLHSLPRLVGRRMLATMLNVSVPTIERLQRDGLIPVVRIGRRVLYSPDPVIAALMECQRKPVADDKLAAAARNSEEPKPNKDNDKGRTQNDAK